MGYRKRLARFAFLMATVVAIGCDSGSQGKDPVDRGFQMAHLDQSAGILCSVAASVREVFESAVANRPDAGQTQVRTNSGPSSGLAAQIEAGAPVDLFLSASPEWGAHLQVRGLTARIVPLLTNRLVLVVPKGSARQIREPRDLAQPGIEHVALAGESVPAGKYAGQALDQLGVLGGLAAAGKIVRGQDVRAALAFVERGEADAGIVYATDARSSELVEVVYEFPSELHEPIAYVLVLLQHGQAKPEAVTLFEWLQSPDALKLFESAGFQPLPAVTVPSADSGSSGERMGAAEVEAIRLTVLVAAVAVAISLPWAVGVAWVLARWRFPGKFLLETFVNLPLVLPPVVTGYLLLVWFGRQGTLGALLEQWLGLRLVFDWKGAALASAVVGFPLLVRPIRQAFAAVDSNLLGAARTLGAGPWDAFFSVALPLARPGMLSGSVLAFARSMGEFGATLMIAGNIPGVTQTVPLLIYTRLDAPGGGNAVTGLVLVSISVSALALLVGELLEQRGQRRLRGVQGSL